MWSKLESHEQNNKGLVIPFQFIDPRKMKIYVNEKDLYKKIWKNPYVQKLEQIHMCINRKTDQLIKWSCGDKKKKNKWHIRMQDYQCISPKSTHCMASLHKTLIQSAGGQRERKMPTELKHYLETEKWGRWLCKFSESVNYRVTYSQGGIQWMTIWKHPQLHLSLWRSTGSNV